MNMLTIKPTPEQMSKAQRYALHFRSKHVREYARGYLRFLLGVTTLPPGEPIEEPPRTKLRVLDSFCLTCEQAKRIRAHLHQLLEGQRVCLCIVFKDGREVGRMACSNSPETFPFLRWAGYEIKVAGMRTVPAFGEIHKRMLRRALSWLRLWPQADNQTGSTSFPRRTNETARP